MRMSEEFKKGKRVRNSQKSVKMSDWIKKGLRILDGWKWNNQRSEFGRSHILHNHRMIVGRK